jgi:hypothetical protein
VKLSDQICAEVLPLPAELTEIRLKEGPRRVNQTESTAIVEADLYRLANLGARYREVVASKHLDCSLNMIRPTGTLIRKEVY